MGRPGTYPLQISGHTCILIAPTHLWVRVILTTWYKVEVKELESSHDKSKPNASIVGSEYQNN